MFPNEVYWGDQINRSKKTLVICKYCKTFVWCRSWLQSVDRVKPGIWCFSARLRVRTKNCSLGIIRRPSGASCLLECCFKADIIIILTKCHMFSPWYGWQMAHLTLNNNNSLIPYIDELAHETTIKTIGQLC